MPEFNRPTRRKVFYSLALLFLLLAPMILLYSRGYIFDFSKRHLVTTGGVFVKSVVPGAKVFIDSTLHSQLSFISHAALISNLEPRRYAIRVEKDGYQSWQKVVRVAGEEVLEFRNIFLPPATITPRIIYNLRKHGEANLSLLAGQGSPVLSVPESSGGATAYVVDTDKGIAPIQIVKATTWSWNAERKEFVIGRGAGGTMRWYRLPVNGVDPAKEVLVDFSGFPKNFSPSLIAAYPQDPEREYFFTEGILYLKGVARSPLLVAEHIHAFGVGKDHLYFITKNGFFAESSLEGENTRALGRKGLFLDSDRPARVFVGPEGDVFVVDSAGGLFIYQSDHDQELTQIVGNIVGLDFSANGDRAILWDEHRIWVYWLADNSNQPFDLARSRKQIYYSDEALSDVFLNREGTYVFFSTKKAVQMVEVDDRGSTNAYTLVPGDIDAFLLDKEQMIIYWLKNAVLYSGKLK